jgi:hypothetical protein
MIALRELAERFRANDAEYAVVDDQGDVTWHSCADELLAILDAEGDAEAVGDARAEVEKIARKLYARWTDNQGVHCNRFPSWGEISQKERGAWIERATAPDTGNADIDKAIGGLMSSDPTFDDCERAAAVLRSTAAATHPQPVRSGVVSDEQVRDAAVAYSKRATDGSQDVNFHDCIRAALTHFAKSQGESNV